MKSDSTTVIKNMEFLVKELHKEWDRSGASKASVIISIEEVDGINDKMSKDEVNYERLIKILSLYRLTLGQARQEELLEYLFKEFKDTSGLKKLFIDLSPFSKGKEG